MTPIKRIYVFSVLIILFSSTLGSPAVAQVLTKKVDPLRPTKASQLHITWRVS